eukprot:767034-Hanusia_phi.AAC.1
MDPDETIFMHLLGLSACAVTCAVTPKSLSARDLRLALRTRGLADLSLPLNMPNMAIGHGVSASSLPPPSPLFTASHAPAGGSEGRLWPDSAGAGAE